MISCEQCQKKLVAIFDNEGREDDEKLTKAHLRDCPACRVFREDMIRLRQQFVSVNVPELSRTMEKELMQVVQADSLRQENRPAGNRAKNQPLLLNFPKLAWTVGLTALFLIVVSWLVCYSLAKEVSDLKSQLGSSRQELAAVRQELMVAQSAMQREEDRRKEQKAISALYFRMQELEERFDRFSSPTTTLLPAKRSRPSGAYGGVQRDVLRKN